MVNRRLAAITSLALSVASVVIAAVVAVQSFPRGLTVLACLVGAVLAAWWALVHQGAARFAAAAGAGVLLVGAVVLVVLEGLKTGIAEQPFQLTAFEHAIDCPPLHVDSGLGSHPGGAGERPQRG